ncbi:MAG TPA: ferritin family protein [Oscillospiraceae bacterium]|nr:ferritin family protein [Oscillospiraceae bacterium]
MEQNSPPRGGMAGAYERENQLFNRVWPRVEERSEQPDREHFERNDRDRSERTARTDRVPAASPAAPTSPAAAPMPKEEEALRRAIEGELADWRTYSALALRGPGRQVFSQIAAEELRHARRLSAAYFTERAVHYFPRQQARSEPASDLMGALRERILHEREGAAAYRRMAEAERGALRPLLETLAAEEDRHAARLMALLESWV